MSLQLNKIIAGNCIEILPTLPDNSFTLAFADPPYWVGFNYGDKTDAEMQYIEPHWLVEQLVRIANVVIVTPGQKAKYDYPRPKWEAVWHKPAAMNVNGFGGVSNFEPMLCYGKGTLKNDYFRALIENNKDASFHNCPKPEGLMRQIIEWTTRPGDSVLDPVSGSGTTCKAAYQLGRDYLGIEIDQQMAELSRQRIAKAQPPLRLPNNGLHATAQPSLFAQGALIDDDTPGA